MKIVQVMQETSFKWLEIWQKCNLQNDKFFEIGSNFYWVFIYQIIFLFSCGSGVPAVKAND